MSRSESQAASRDEVVETLGRMGLRVDPEALLAAMCCHLLMLPRGTYSEGKHGDVILRLELLTYHLAPYFDELARRAPGPDQINFCVAALHDLRRMRPGQDQDGAPTIIRDLRCQAELVGALLILIRRLRGLRGCWDRAKSGSRAGVGLARGAPSRSLKRSSADTR